MGVGVGVGGDFAVYGSGVGSARAPRGWQGAHVNAAPVCPHLHNTRAQVGEAPDEIRNVCRQRSRWTKGHMQVGGRMRVAKLNTRICITRVHAGWGVVVGVGELLEQGALG